MRKVFFIGIFALFAAGIYYGLVYSKWSSYHNFEGRCQSCHLTVPAEGMDPGTFVKDITFMCTDCHKDIKTLSHPVDIRPKGNVPASFPLDWKGDLSCVSCHFAHRQGFGNYHMRVTSTGAGLCQNCHSDIDDKMHKTGVETAHLGGSISAKQSPGELFADLDELSFRCLSCHDALVGRDAVVDSREVMLGFHDKNLIGVSHPVGVSYIEAKRKYMGAYRDLNKLPPEIRLFGGLVGCGTCHNPYSKRHYDLVMSNEGSKLCLACHVK